MKRISGGFTFWWRASDATHRTTRLAAIAVATIASALLGLWMAVQFMSGLAAGLALLCSVPGWYVAPLAAVALYFCVVK